MGDFRVEFCKKLDEVDNLPTISPVFVALQEALSDLSAGAEDVARVISEDISLTAKVLRIVNSAYFSPAAGPIASVSKAVARIGFSEIRRICTALEIIRSFKAMHHDINPEDFWKHSLMSAITTKVIEQYRTETGDYSEDSAYISGLLHDVGLLLLNCYFPEVYQEVLKAAENENESYAEVERRMLGMDHGEMGGALLERWHFPEAIIQGVSWHHEPMRAKAKHRPLAQAIHLADFICTSLGIGATVNGPNPARKFYDSVWIDLAMSVEDLPVIMDRVNKEEQRCVTILTAQH